MMGMGQQQQPQQWKSFSLTHITYPVRGHNPPSSQQQQPLYHKYLYNYNYNSQFLPLLLALLSLTPPFVVCALTTSTLLHKDVLAAYLLMGSISSSIIVSILKMIIKEPRPPRYDDDVDEEVEYGMPSNHSSFAFFCATFVILYVLRGGAVWAARSLPSYSIRYSTTSDHYGDASLLSSNRSSLERLSGIWHHLHTTITIFLSLFIAVGCAYSRVYLGYHTTMQVIVGSSIGVLLGSIWYGFFEMELVRGLLIRLDSTIFELERIRKERAMLCFEEDLGRGKEH